MVEIGLISKHVHVKYTETLLCKRCETTKIAMKP